MKKKLKLLGIVIGLLFCVGVTLVAFCYREPKVAVLSYHNVAKREECPDEDPWCVKIGRAHV